jgi:hypothetical protein
MDIVTLAIAKAKAKKYTDSVALNGVPVNYPQIVGGTWRVFNPVTNSYIDTGISAQGQDGIIPAIGVNGNWFIGAADTGVVAQGQDGLSAFEIWLAQGNIGSETDFLASIKGETGEKGVQGDRGNDGQDGVDGIGVPTGGKEGQVLTINALNSEVWSDIPKISNADIQTILNAL